MSHIDTELRGRGLWVSDPESDGQDRRAVPLAWSWADTLTVLVLAAIGVFLTVGAL